MRGWLIVLTVIALGCQRAPTDGTPYCDVWDGRTECYSVVDLDGRPVEGVVLSCRGVGPRDEAVSGSDGVACLRSWLRWLTPPEPEGCRCPIVHAEDPSGGYARFELDSHARVFTALPAE